ETFLENLRILAIDQMLSNLDNKAVVAKTVTIEVTPKQAEMVNVATGLGSISLSLRSLAANPANDNPVKSPENGDGNYSTNNDVSRLMDGGVSKKVNVYHGSNPAEQLNFREDKK
ncbi:MAG: RcpC/CpaB family pilus assembly protein, partial [Pseudomonadota bacterium]